MHDRNPLGVGDGGGHCEGNGYNIAIPFLWSGVFMSDRPNKEQMMKIVVPALAIAVVLVLIGLIIGLKSEPEPPKDDKLKPGAQTIRAQPSISGDDEGMSDTAPATDTPEWKDIGGGLKIWDVKEGEGDPCPAGAGVTMHYSGWFLNGQVFDSSRSKLKPGPGMPLESPLGSLVDGWQKGVPGMKKGGIRRLYVPYQMAYGESGRGSIPPRADLIFEMKLLGFR